MSFASLLRLSLVCTSISIAVACGDDGTSSGGAGVTGGSGGGGASTGGAAEGGASAGCDANNLCDGGVCFFGEDACEPGAVGTCTPGNGACDGPPTGPVCDCQGVVHELRSAVDFPSCELGAQGIPFGPAEACSDGTFACGGSMCKNHVDVCFETAGGVNSEPSFECIPQSDFVGCSGGVADCACLQLFTVCGPLGLECSCVQDPATKQETVTAVMP